MQNQPTYKAIVYPAISLCFKVHPEKDHGIKSYPQVRPGGEDYHNLLLAVEGSGIKPELLRRKAELSPMLVNVNQTGRAWLIAGPGKEETFTADSLDKYIAYLIADMVPLARQLGSDQRLKSVNPSAWVKVGDLGTQPDLRTVLEASRTIGKERVVVGIEHHALPPAGILAA